MLGRQLPSGSQAISFHNTLFRVSELCWVKVVRLSVAEKVVKGLAFLLAVVWVFAMEQAKTTYYNLEFLLAIFPLALGWSTAGSLKLGCTGDFEETYEQRQGMRRGLFTGWIETLKAKEPNWVHLQSPTYDFLLNPNRLAWIRPVYQWKFYPLVVAGVFFGYHYLLNLNLNIGSLPVVDDFQVLSFEGGVGNLKILSLLLVALSLVAFGLSVKRSVELCGTGGVQDIFPLSAKDQVRLLDLFAGSSGQKTAASAKKAGKAQGSTLEVKVASPEQKKPPKPEESKKTTEDKGPSSKPSDSQPEPAPEVQSQKSEPVSVQEDSPDS